MAEIKNFEGLTKALGDLMLEKGTGPFHEEINYYNILGLINSFGTSVKDAIKLIDECSENETHLDDELCKKCPLYKEGEAGIFCSDWILRRILGEGEGGEKKG